MSSSRPDSALATRVRGLEGTDDTLRDSTVARIRVVALIALLTAGIATVAHRCIGAGMDWEVSARYWFYAMPSYFSEVTYGAPRYTFHRDMSVHFATANPFQKPSQFQPIIDAARTHAVAVRTWDVRYFPGDEKGTVDFVRLAFNLFGPQVKSILYLYMTIVGVSLGLFAARFRREPAVLLIGVLAVAALYVAIGAFLATKEVYAVTNPRAIGSASLFAFVHLLMLMLVRPARTWDHVPALIAQSAIVVFVITMRTAELWQVISLVSVAAVLTVTRFRRVPEWWSAALVVTPLLALVLAHQAYQRPSIGHVIWRTRSFGTTC
jgi:disulfide bond formation protein DsbB